jgi:ribose transport system substrate-binding protein
MSIRRALGLLFLLVLVFAGAGFVACSSEASTQTVIAVIPKGTTHEFWKAIHAGALVAAQDLGVEIIWKGPQREDDREGQVKVVEDFISRRVSGIVLAPMDDQALVPVVQEAAREKIPVLVIDSGLKPEGPRISYLATDNYQGGVLGARRLGELCGSQGKVLLLRYQEGSASTTEREAGFLDTIRQEFPQIQVVSSNQYAGAKTETAYKKSEDLLNQWQELDGVFCPNESATMGMLRALQDDGRAGKVWFVGFDQSDKLIEGLRQGDIHGLVLQDPFAMGEHGVRRMVAHLRGEKLQEVEHTTLLVATPENMNEPEPKRLLSPDLSILDR